jgi:hypothetical protein
MSLGRFSSHIVLAGLMSLSLPQTAAGQSLPSSAESTQTVTVLPGLQPVTLSDDLSEIQHLELSQSLSTAQTSLYLGGGTVVMGLATIATNGAGTAPRVFGGATLLLAGASTPMAASAGSRARRVASMRGIHTPSSSSRMLAWGGYGLTMGLGTAVFAAGLSEADISSRLIFSLTALSGLSTIAMAQDSMASIRLAAQPTTQEEAATVRPAGPEIHFTAAVLPGQASVGLIGSF